jgi:soluble lytic murein transglycosylase-like protein
MIPTWAFNLPWKEISAASSRHAVDRLLVAAIVKTESNGNAAAMRFEPGFRYEFQPSLFATRLGITWDTEKVLQSSSIGLMQVMGVTARELGHAGPLTDLLDPKIGLDYGCRKLRKLTEIHPTTDVVVAAYNAGSPRRTADGVAFVNQEYVDRVMGYYRDLKEK